MSAARTPAVARRMVQFATAVSTLALIATMAAPASAQVVTQPAPDQPDTDPTPGDPGIAPAPETTAADGSEIVVTGIRAGLRNSIETKRRNQSIVEVVSAEDIGKLPDLSIAESIARLPGLAAQRVNGRAQVISIRGLSPDFTTTLLNGRPQASSGDNRAVEFDQYPSELLNSVVIYKTPDANIAGMGLSGTADLRTVRPLTFGKRAIAVNVRGELDGTKRVNSDVRNYGGRLSVSYIDQLTPQLGVAIGFAHLDSPSHNKHFKGYNYETFDCCDFTKDRISPDSADSATFLTGQEVFNYSRRNVRDAVMGILEWQPDDKLHTIVDLYYSRFKQRETMRGTQWFSNVWADSQTFTNVTTEDRGGTELAVTGTANGVAPQLRNDYNTRDDWLFSAGINNEYKFTDQLSLIGDLSYSSNKRKESIVETYAGYGCCVTAPNQNDNRVFDSISWDITGSGFPTYGTGLNYADASQVSLGDRAPWGGWGHDGAMKNPDVRENVYSGDLDLRYEPRGIFEAIDIGANFTRRDKKKHVDEWDLMLKNGRMQVLVGSDVLVNPTSLGFAGLGDTLSYNVPDAIDQYYDITVLEDANHFDKAWHIREDIWTLKARAMFAAGNLHGNVGVQLVHQDQQSEGQRINTDVLPIEITPVSDGAKYTDFLPSLNAYYDLGGGHRIRFAAAKVLARPRMDEMRANLTPGFGNPCLGSPPCVPGQEIHPWSASGGNPRLKPWRAKALDLAYEWYIGKGSYVAVAGFYKKLDTYIYTQTLPYDFSGLPLPSTAAGIPAGVIISPIGTISQPANGNGGSIKGIELSGAIELGRLTRMLDGFGIIGSLSKTKTNLNPTPDQTQEVRIPGLSGTVASLTGYFEKNGFQARVGYRYRSPFKGEVVQLFATRGFTEILADKQVDAQVGYTFPETSRMLPNLGIQLQVNNVTDSPYRTLIGVDGGPTTANGSRFIETYEKYGRQWLLGFNYRF
ncbi:TonB-dependent receptor [Sphingomonas sp.]|uniref:TonB-dependent receptor n=1 Tax=Sphingomonas sp. TaxID=28214 RepID=UPI00286ABD03|nr:TonB-dependent receptor [Sphingomonas sp.]